MAQKHGSFLNDYYLVSMMIQSFNDGNIYGLARGSDAGNIYAIGKPSATITFHVQYFFLNIYGDTYSN